MGGGVYYMLQCKEGIAQYGNSHQGYQYGKRILLMLRRLEL